MTSEIVEKIRRNWECFKAEFRTHYEAFTEVDPLMRSQALTREELCDLGFFFREVMNLADELRKECKARTELSGKLLCLASLSEGDTTTRGKYATGSSDGGLVPLLPKPGTDEYEQLCRFYGVAESHGGLIRFHWKTLKEQMEQAAAEGKEFPVKIQSVPEFKTVFRRRTQS